MAKAQTLEWRSEDHPAAGVVLAPAEPQHVIFYVHHAVKGTTVRKGAVPRVRAYRIASAQLLRLTVEGVRQLVTQQ